MLKNKTLILIIDDDEFLLDMYSVKFREEGFDVDLAKGAREALDKLKGGLAPDVILLDIVMPGVDGFSFLEEAKKEKLLGKSKVIILSNLGQKDQINKGFSLGADDFVVKAYFNPSEVVKKVDSLLKKNKK